MGNKQERIDIRLSNLDKEMFKRAQRLSGDKSVSSFIMRVVKEQAEQIVEKIERIIASEKDRKIFFEAVFTDNAPNQNLLDAATRYKNSASQ